MSDSNNTLANPNRVRIDGKTMKVGYSDDPVDFVIDLDQYDVEIKYTVKPRPSIPDGTLVASFDKSLIAAKRDGRWYVITNPYWQGAEVDDVFEDLSYVSDEYIQKNYFPLLTDSWKDFEYDESD